MRTERRKRGKSRLCREILSLPFDLMGKRLLTQTPAIPTFRSKPHKARDRNAAPCRPQTGRIVGDRMTLWGLAIGKLSHGDQTVKPLTMIKMRLPRQFSSIRQTDRMGHGSMT